jgi:para-aminobenzoate synthetase component 1
MLNWLRRFSIFAFLDSNGDRQYEGNYELLVAAGSVPNSILECSDDLSVLDKQSLIAPDWLFGHINYDFKNQLEPGLQSDKPARTGFKMLYFFKPFTVVYIGRDALELVIESFDQPQLVYEEIMGCDFDKKNEVLPAVKFNLRVDKEKYLSTVSVLKDHISRGDCYEINYCTEGFAEHVQLDPYMVYIKLSELSPAPFSALYRNGESYLVCASPERYLHKKGREIVAQPMKGTMRRGKDSIEDEKIRMQLVESLKERAENVMITDLMRNDLARCCVPGSIMVSELFKVLSFLNVHQMISTVRGIMVPDARPSLPIACSFPMGSMTGAPKYRVMQLIEQYEASRRELFSGTLGYFDPNGDFDFNVVIRSLFYNEATGYLSYHTGGAITFDSDALQEWNERNLKAWALERIFAGESS